MKTILEHCREQWAHAVPLWFRQTLPRIKGGHPPRLTFAEATMYCPTPPVIPPYGPNDFREGAIYCIKSPCIVCGGNHTKHVDCGREPSAGTRRTAIVRRDDGYKLEQARNMGLFDECDNWD